MSDYLTTSEILILRSFSTRIAFASSAFNQLRSPLSLCAKRLPELGLSPYISFENTERLSHLLFSSSKKFLAFISAKVENKLFIKLSTQIFARVHNSLYYCNSVGVSHYTRLKRLSMPNIEPEVRRREYVWHFDF